LTSHACTISFLFLSWHLWHIGLALRKQVSISISFPLSVTKQRSTKADGGPSRIASHHQARRHKTARHLEDECKIWFLYQKEGMDDTTTFSTLQFVLTPFLWSFQFFFGSASSHDYFFFFFSYAYCRFSFDFHQLAGLAVCTCKEVLE
jgi:hypothetical protein